MRVTEAKFRRLALDDPESHWELWDGVPRKKPAMTIEHNWEMRFLGRMLVQQLDMDDYDVIVNMGHVHHSSAHYYIPDVYVVPMRVVRALRQQPRQLEVYEEPLPLVVEVWSPSTGAYDINEKLMQYQRRGDLEIWRLHPYDRTLTAWRRQPDGGYSETLFTGGTVTPVALPGVVIDISALFA
ncbi:MAG: Uma2 family endonuclease [Dehalococcoidia bacterium]